MNEIKSILLDTSFLIRLSKQDDQFHLIVKEYFYYFLEKRIQLFLSTIAMSEYAVANDPNNILILGYL